MPNAQQQANALNPTPVNITLPGQGKVFRTDNGSGTPSDIYYYNNNQLQNLSLSDLGKQTYGQNIDSLGGQYNYRNGTQQAGIDALKSKYGIDYNSIGLGNYNMADVGGSSGQFDVNQLSSLLAAQNNVGGNQTKTLNGQGTGDSVAQSLAQAQAAPNGNQLNAQTQALQGSTGTPSTPTPGASSMGSASGSYGAPTSSPTSSGPAFPTGSLQPGQSGPQVKALQDYLVSQHLMTQDQVNTGYGNYGPQTTAAVQALQQKLGVNGGQYAGYYGPQTLAAIQAGMQGATGGSTGAGTGSPTGAPTPAQAAPAPGTPAAYLAQLMQAQQQSPDVLAAQASLNKINQQAANINASENMGETDINGQPIAMPFITGQKAQLQAQANSQLVGLGAQAVGPTQQLAAAQARQQAAIDVAKTALDYSKPVSLPYGGQLVNPSTGATVNGGLFGSSGASGGGAGINPSTGLTPSSSTSDILGYLSKNGVNPTRYDMPGLINAVQNGATAQDIISGKTNVAAQTSAATSGSSYKFNTATQSFQQPNPSAGTSGSSGTRSVSPAPSSFSGSSSASSGPLASLSAGAFQLATTGEYPSKAGSAQQTAYMNEVRKAIPGFNPQIAKANAGAIDAQTKQQADVTRGITAADSNFNLMTSTFKGKVNDFSSPLANQVNNAMQKGLLGNSDVINFQSAVSTLQTEYATVLGRGGEVTDSVRASAQKVINGDYSMNDLISLHSYIDQEGKNVIDSYTKTISNLASGGSSQSSTSSSQFSPTSARAKYNY